MRLIDADVFEELFHKQIEYGATDIFDAVEDALQDTPAIDAVPVVHARWDRLMGDYYCTNCDKRLRRSSRTKRPKYCERCGARMDEKEND